MAQVEVYEVLRLVSYEGAEVSANDAVPGRPFALVELKVISWYEWRWREGGERYGLLDVHRDILVRGILVTD